MSNKIWIIAEFNEYGEFFSIQHAYTDHRQALINLAAWEKDAEDTGYSYEIIEIEID